MGGGGGGGVVLGQRRGEDADSALLSKNRRETPRLEPLQRRRNNAGTMLEKRRAGDVSDAVASLPEA